MSTRPYFSGFIFIFLLIVSSSNADTECQDDIEWAKKAAEPLADFTVLLYRAISSGDSDQNTVFSPISIAFALSLLEAGAVNDTRSQFRYVLVKRGSRDSDTENIYQALRYHLKPKEENKVKLNIVNGIYHQPQIRLKEDYLNSIRSCLDSAVEKCDFKSDSEDCRKRINSWVSESTQQKIPELFKTNTIDKNTGAILASTVNFKAVWKLPFTKDKLEIRKFYQNGGEEEPEEVEFLVNQDQYLYSEANGISIVGIPYKGGEYNLYIILPRKRDGLPDAERHLAGAELLFLINRTRFHEVELKIPKFNITTSVDLKPVLTSVGVNDMFGNSANFGRMTDSKLRVDAAAHQAFISVNENGTEASASKVFSMRPISMPPPPVPFVANHPFLYAIVHQPTHAIIFAGKVVHIEQ